MLGHPAVLPDCMLWQLRCLRTAHAAESSAGGRPSSDAVQILSHRELAQRGQLISSYRASVTFTRVRPWYCAAALKLLIWGQPQARIYAGKGARVRDLALPRQHGCRQLARLYKAPRSRRFLTRLLSAPAFRVPGL